MKKKIILLLSILILIVSAVILIFGAMKNNNTARIVGYSLLAIVGILNIVNGFIRWDEGK